MEITSLFRMNSEEGEIFSIQVFGGNLMGK
jgi:hypothetical protein